VARKHPFIDQTNKFIGDKIYSLRLGRGLSRKQLAEAVGVTQQQLMKYEKAENTIALGRLLLIADALDTSIEYFSDGLKDNQTEPTPTNHQRMCIEVSRNFMKLTNPDHQSALNVMLKSLIKMAA